MPFTFLSLRRWAGLACVLSAMALTGCVATGRAPLGSLERAQAVNAELQDRVLARLRADRRLDVRVLSVSAIDGVVTISGQPEQPWQRDLALSLAAGVWGVRTVVNNMTLN